MIVEAVGEAVMEETAMDEMVHHNLIHVGKNLNEMAVREIKIPLLGSCADCFKITFGYANKLYERTIIFALIYFFKGTVGSMVEIVMAEVVASLERAEEIMTDVPAPQRIGQYHCHVTKESKLNSSVSKIVQITC